MDNQATETLKIREILLHSFTLSNGEGVKDCFLICGQHR
jgi:hypothetical protein